MSGPMIHARVVAKSMKAPGIAAFVLASEGGEPLPVYSAGAHIDISLPNGMTRQYSLCGEQGDPTRYEIAVLRDGNGRGGSAFLHDSVRVGDLLKISQPRNLFPLVEAGHSVLFAGGIGITPLLAMARTLAARSSSFELHYFVRSQDRAAYLDVLEHLVPAGALHLHVGDRIPPSFAVDQVLGAPSSGAHFYTCGPNPFMDALLDLARARGWREAQLHSERFAAVVGGDERPFDIELASSGRIVPVLAGQTAAEALALSGITLPMSCEQGICGTCLTTVLSGLPDHRDSYLSDDERLANDCFTPCCSRALTPRLTLDL